eukprot:m.239373 g.239373  ORF g.239373 m.239373 type:complete len:321 (+) comp40181_c2_seq26:70-1032(+)
MASAEMSSLDADRMTWKRVLESTMNVLQETVKKREELHKTLTEERNRNEDLQSKVDALSELADRLERMVNDQQGRLEQLENELRHERMERQFNERLATWEAEGHRSWFEDQIRQLTELTGRNFYATPPPPYSETPFPEDQQLPNNTPPHINQAESSPVGVCALPASTVTGGTYTSPRYPDSVTAYRGSSNVIPGTGHVVEEHTETTTTTTTTRSTRVVHYPSSEVQSLNQMPVTGASPSAMSEPFSRRQLFGDSGLPSSLPTYGSSVANSRSAARAVPRQNATPSSPNEAGNQQLGVEGSGLRATFAVADTSEDGPGELE